MRGARAAVWGLAALSTACSDSGAPRREITVVDGVGLMAGSLQTPRIAHTVISLGPGDLRLIGSGSAIADFSGDPELVVGGVATVMTATTTAERIDAEASVPDAPFEVRVPFTCQQIGDRVLDVSVEFVRAGDGEVIMASGAVDVRCTDTLEPLTLQRMVIKDPARSTLADLRCAEQGSVPYHPSFLVEIFGDDPLPDGTFSLETLEGTQPAELVQFPEFPTQVAVMAPDERPYRFAVTYVAADEGCRIEAAVTD